MKGIIVYSSRYGATSQYANWIGSALGLPVKNVKDIGPEELAGYDFIILGSSIYMGKILLKEWLKQNGSRLTNKKLLFFIVGAANGNEKEKTKKYFTDNIPEQLLNNNYCFYLQGKMTFKQLSLSDKFFLKMGTWLAQTEKEKKTMLTDFDAVKEGNLSGLLQTALKIIA